MMCCSSLLLGGTKNAISSVLSTGAFKNFEIPSLIDVQRQLKSSDKNKGISQQTLNSPLEEDVLMKEEEESSVVSTVSQMVNGKYTYLTYLLLSTTCFFFWLTPNMHKMKNFFVRAPANFKQY